MGKAIYIGKKVQEFLDNKKNGSYNKTLRKLLGIDLPREQLATQGQLEELKYRVEKIEDFIKSHS